MFKFLKTKLKKNIEKISKSIKKELSEKQFENLFHNLEITLLQNNTSLQVIEKIKQDLKINLINKKIKDPKKQIKQTLKNTLQQILNTPKINLIKNIKNKKPYIILFIGYNGSGKTITCAKLSYYLKKHNIKPILAAADLFRAAGSTQLAQYVKKINIPVITQEKGDPCALIFDAIKSAKAKNYDVVLADTAGRIHSNTNLLEELKKIIRVNKPDLKILILDALTGTDIVKQCQEFNKLNIDALIITKTDCYKKTGSILSAAYTLKKPILFLGTGQSLNDLKEYNPEQIIKNII